MGTGHALAIRSSLLNEDALEVSRRLGDTAGVAVALGNLAESAGRVGDIEGARERFAEAVAASRALQSTQRLTEQYWQLGFFEISVGAPDRALLAFKEAAVQAAAGGLEEHLLSARAYMAFAEAELGDSDAAERFRANATQAFENPNLRAFGQVRISYLVLRAALASVAGHFTKAARALGAIETAESEGVLWWTLAGLRDRVHGEVQASSTPAEIETAKNEGRHLGVDEIIGVITGE